MKNSSREISPCLELTDDVLETVTGGYYGMTSDPYGSSNPEGGPWTAWGPAQNVGGDGSGGGGGGAAGAAGAGMGESMGDSCGSGNCA